jgi:hypothetical protein
VLAYLRNRRFSLYKKYNWQIAVTLSIAEDALCLLIAYHLYLPEEREGHQMLYEDVSRERVTDYVHRALSFI